MATALQTWARLRSRPAPPGCASRPTRRPSPCASGCPDVPVLVMGPLVPGEEPEVHDVEVAVSSREAYDRLRAGASAPLAVHVKLDSGMGRWGMAPARRRRGRRRAGRGNGTAAAGRPDEPPRLGRVGRRADVAAAGAVRRSVRAGRAVPAPRRQQRCGAGTCRRPLGRRALRHRGLRGLAVRRRSGGARAAAGHALRELRRAGQAARAGGRHGLRPSLHGRSPGLDRPRCRPATRTASRGCCRGGWTCSPVGGGGPSSQPSAWTS